jgi:hypothetical protein
MVATSNVLPGVRAISESKFCLAADLGQSTDPTALAAIEHVVTTHVTWRGKETRAAEQFKVRFLQRLPLGLSYVDQVRQIGNLLTRPPLDTADLVIDETGVGRPVGDLFNMFGLKPIRVTITAGENQSGRGVRWHVPKSILISGLDARLHTGELIISDALPEAAALKEELRDFRRHVSAAGRFSYDARAGKHDDLILAVALALWNFVGKTKYPTAQVGTYHYGSPIT